MENNSNLLDKKNYKISVNIDTKKIFLILENKEDSMINLKIIIHLNN